MILVCGEALFDMFADDPAKDPIAFEAHIGGSPFNVAVGIARQEQQVAFFGGVSNDTLGQKLVDRLRSEDVDIRYLFRTDALTTLSVVQKDVVGNPAYTFYGEGAADRAITPDDLPGRIDNTNILHVGSYTMLVEPVASALKMLLRREMPNCLISFDPNIRPTVVPDMALWRRNTSDVAAMADIIKVSDEDLALIHPGEDPQILARQWVANGALLVIITKGANGAEAFTANDHTNVPGIGIDVVDTVGAGDTFQATLLSDLVSMGIESRLALAKLDAKALNGLLLHAIQASALTCTRRGADLPRRAELPSLEMSC